LQQLFELGAETSRLADGMRTTTSFDRALDQECLQIALVLDVSLGLPALGAEQRRLAM